MKWQSKIYMLENWCQTHWASSQMWRCCPKGSPKESFKTLEKLKERGEQKLAMGDIVGEGTRRRSSNRTQINVNTHQQINPKRLKKERQPWITKPFWRCNFVGNDLKVQGLARWMCGREVHHSRHIAVLCGRARAHWTCRRRCTPGAHQSLALAPLGSSPQHFAIPCTGTVS